MENDLSHLPEKLMLECMHHGWGSNLCKDLAHPALLSTLVSRREIGNIRKPSWKLKYTLGHVAFLGGFWVRKVSLMSMHAALFMGMSDSYGRQLQRYKGSIFEGATSDEEMVNKALADNFRMAGCQSPKLSRSFLDELKAQATEAELVAKMVETCREAGHHRSGWGECCGVGPVFPRSRRPCLSSS